MLLKLYATHEVCTENLFLCIASVPFGACNSSSAEQEAITNMNAKVTVRVQFGHQMADATRKHNAIQR